MSSNKSSKNNFPYSSEIKKMKDTFKRTIDEMSDEEFIDFISFLMFSSDEDFEDDDWDFNEMWEDDSEILQDYEDVNSDDDILPF